jgi:hypothetical protein
VALGALGVLLFERVLLFGGPLRGSDWAAHLPYYDWIRTSLRLYGTYPLYFPTALHTPNFVANAQSPLFGPLVPLLAILPAAVYVKLLVTCWLTLGMVGVWLWLRARDVDVGLAAAVAALFVFNGYFSAHLAVGHHWALGSLALPMLLYLLDRGAKGSDAASVWAGVLSAVTLFEGQHHPFIWNNLFLLLFAITTAMAARRLAALRAWAIFLATTACVGAVKLAPMLSEFRDYAPEQKIMGIPPLTLLWSVVSDAQGMQTVRPEMAMLFGAGWWEYCFFLGISGAALLVVGLAGVAFSSRRATDALAVAIPSLVFLFLALHVPFGDRFPSPWELVENLPVWRTQRAPSRFTIVALTGLLLMAGLGAQALLDRVRPVRLRRALPWAAMLVILAELHAFSVPWQEAAHVGDVPVRDYVFGTPPTQVVPVTLERFSPNHLVYHVESAETPDPRWIVLPFEDPDHRLEWRPIGLRAGWSDTGLLLVEIPSRTSEVVLQYRPQFFLAGALVSMGSLALLALWHVRRR